MAGPTIGRHFEIGKVYVSLDLKWVVVRVSQEKGFILRSAGGHPHGLKDINFFTVLHDEVNWIDLSLGEQQVFLDVVCPMVKNGLKAQPAGCTCDSHSLFNQGCTCGWIKIERAKK